LFFYKNVCLVLSYHVAFSNHHKRITLWPLHSLIENTHTITFIQILRFEISETLIDFFLTSGKEGRYQVILKKIDLPVVPQDACLQALRKTRLGPYFKLHESFICAGGIQGKDTCKVMISCSCWYHSCVTAQDFFSGAILNLY
jgi:hypothetical protein